MYKLKQFLDKIAFFKGRSDFMKGELNPPKYTGDSLREWHRGQNYAYFKILENNKRKRPTVNVRDHVNNLQKDAI